MAGLWIRQARIRQINSCTFCMYCVWDSELWLQQRGDFITQVAASSGLLYLLLFTLYSWLVLRSQELESAPVKETSDEGTGAFPAQEWCENADDWGRYRLVTIFCNITFF